MSNEILGLLMLGTLLVVIFIGFPIAFTLIILAILFGYFSLGKMVFDLMVMQTFGLMQEEVLAAVPLFVFMGYVVEQAGLMERLFMAFRHVLSGVKGSLFVGVILTAAIFAMATGIVGAAVTVLGIMAAPVMIRCGYNDQLSAGTIIAGGTLGILIPPSIMLVVMGPVLGISVAKLYAAAFGPGFLLTGLYVIYLLIRNFLNPELGPVVPMDERISRTEKIKEFFFGMVPLGSLIFFTLGSILAGLATPTEAAACGACGGILMALAYRKLTLPKFKEALIKTLSTSSMVLFLAVAANIFGSVFSRLGSATLITNSLIALDLSPFMMLLLLMVVIFILGWPFEWPAIVLIFLPIFLPLILTLKFNLVWFGALVAVNLQTAFLSPPVAMSAYYLKAVVPQWKLSTIYRGVIEFMVIQLIALFLLMLFPEIALWLPGVLFG
ncbi:MAG: TRAP transporter large permease subunit [Deltaproteobacteria bacterium]|nr:TRAP transporter large permease subunit [Deltaproteobacteria bacterium]MDO9210470.1 TRAP transporter large permease subunit [Deltaproteobacteria bacterium]